MKQQTREFYERDAFVYDERWEKRGGKKTLQSQKKIVDTLSRDWQGNIIEIGCGSGRFSSQVVAKGRFSILFDLSLQMLRVTKHKLSNGPKRFVGINGSVYNIPLESETFDAAISINVFNHLAEPQIALAEINRILKPKGLLLVNFSNLHSYFWPIAKYVNYRKKSIGRSVYAIWYAPRDIYDIVETAGFTVDKVAGNVYVPKHLDYSLIREIPLLLDKLSKYSPFKSLSPSLFLACRKK